MKKLLALALCACMLFVFGAQAEPLTGEAEGFGGPVKVTLTMDGDKIVDIQIVGDDETAGIGGAAIEELLAKIRETGSAKVDAVAGATVTSEAVFKAIAIALGEAQPEAKEEKAPAAPAEVAAADATIGFGMMPSGRLGPGKDDKDVQVYSFNEVYANAIFDKDGKILYAYLDQMEVATPNYDGAGMPHFSGFPGQGGYNYDENHDEKVDGVKTVDDAGFQQEVAEWMTKRQRGEGYRMGTGTWTDQANRYQELFLGKTVEEIEDWFGKYTSDRNGRPLKAGAKDEGDAKKYDALTDEEKAMLADVTSAATMSLKDSHGDILSAIRASFENRLPVNLTIGK